MSETKKMQADVDCLTDKDDVASLKKEIFRLKSDLQLQMEINDTYHEAVKLAVLNELTNSGLLLKNENLDEIANFVAEVYEDCANIQMERQKGRVEK